MKTVKKLSLVLTAALAAFAVTGLAQDAQAKQDGPKQDAPKPASGAAALPVTVAVQKVTEDIDLQVRRYTGQAVSPAVVQIVPRVTGELFQVGFKDGSLVKQGQLLYQLNPVQYEAAVKSAEARIAEYKAKLAYAESSYDRSSKLFDMDSVSQDELENTKSVLEAYKAGLMAAEAELTVAKDNLNNTKIVAPISGQVGVTNFTKGNYMTPSSGVMVTILQVQPIRVRFSMSTRDLLSFFDSKEDLMKNANVKLTLANGMDYDEAGIIELVNNQANSHTDSVQVYAQFPNAKQQLIVGSTLAVTISHKDTKKYPAVSPTALMFDQQGTYVFVVDENKIPKKRYVVTGNTTETKQLITSGLAIGELVITKGTNKVREGAALTATIEE